MIDRSESLYGERLIVDWRGARFLIADGTSQGVFSIADGRDVQPYEQVMGAVLHEWRQLRGTPQMEGILCGLGTGALPNRLSDIARVEVFELDPRIPQMAAKHFGFDPVRHPVRIGDGRQLAREHAPATADFVAIDAYASETDDRNPIDLYWRETARRMRQDLWKNVPHELILS